MLAALAAAGLAGCNRAPAPPGSPSPRVLLVTLGVPDEQASAAAPVALPSLASLMTGVPPSRHGVVDGARQALAPAARTLAEAFHDAGFVTAAFVGSPRLAVGSGLEQGFDRWVAGGARDAAADAALKFVDELAPDARWFVWLHVDPATDADEAARRFDRGLVPTVVAVGDAATAPSIVDVAPTLLERAGLPRSAMPEARPFDVAAEAWPLDWQELAPWGSAVERRLVELGLVGGAAGEPLERAVAASPRVAALHHDLALAYDAADEPPLAAREMAKAALLAPDDLAPLRWLVAHHRRRGEWDETAWWTDRILGAPGVPESDLTELRRMRAVAQRRVGSEGGRLREPAPMTGRDLMPERWRQIVDAAPVALRQPRRVLLVTLDTTRADRIGCYGHAQARTPFLDRMAAEGVRFARAWCAAPITLPSHATILTGVYPCAHGVRDNGLFVLGDGATLLPEALKSAGFATGAFVGSFVLDARFGLAQGFDLYRGPALAALGLKPEVVQRPASAVVDDAIGWLDGLAADASFFAWVHFYDPHAPHEAPAGSAVTNADPYDGEIAYCDAQLARLRQRIAERGFDDGLLEIVTADHGEGLGEHGEESHGQLLHDATMRVPLLVRGAGAQAGLVVDASVSNSQIAPTVVRWLGMGAGALPEARVGPLPLAASEADVAAAAESAPLLLETFLPFHTRRRHPLLGLVAQGRKLVRGRFDELFDLAADPAELASVAAGQEEVVKAMARSLDATVAAQPRLPASHGPPLTAEERAQLEALGYGGAAAAPDGAPDATLPDPRESIGDDAEQWRARALLQQGRELLGQDAALAGSGSANRTDEQRARGRQALEEARRILAALAARYPRDPMVALDLGTVELAAGRPAEAASHFEVAVAADPENSTGHYNLAVAYAGAGEPAFALAEMEKTIACEPRFVRAWKWIVMTHEQRGEIARAAWWVDRLDAANLLDPAELPPMRTKRDQLHARLRELGQQPSPSPTWPPKDLRPEGVRVASEKR